MKEQLKKIHRNFKLNAEIEEELRKRSAQNGVTQTRTIEDALIYWFNGGERAALQSRLKKMERAKGFEPSTFTLAR